jgi:hypothetical protein
MRTIYFGIAFALLNPSIASARWCETKFEWVSIRDISKSPTTFYVSQGKIYPGGEQDPEPLKDVDINTFKVAIPKKEMKKKSSTCRDSYWGKDKRHVYFANTVLAQADTATFEPLSEQIGKDKNHVYCWDFHRGGFAGEVNQIADPRTFRKLIAPGDSLDSQFWYYRDATNIFSKWCTLVQGADPQSFEMIKNPTEKFDAKDSKRKFSLGKAID